MADIERLIDMKTSGLTEVVDVVNNVYDEAVLKRSLPYVVKLNLETNEQPVGDTVTTVIVEYRNGLSMSASCVRTPIDTQELVNIAACGSQQVLSTYVHRAVFNYGSKTRTLTRFLKSISSHLNSNADLLEVYSSLDCDITKFSDTQAGGDSTRFLGGTPDGAPGLREILLTVQGVAIEQAYDLRSSAQVQSKLLRDPLIIAPPAPPTISKEQANRATKAMSDLLAAVRIEDNTTLDHTDECEF